MRKLLRVLGWMVGIALGAVVALVVVAQVNLSRHAERHYALEQVSLPEAASPDALERGRYLATTRGCVECHGADFGGAVAVDAGPVGRFVGTNLTAGGRGKVYDAARFEHALRHGVSAEGRPLLFMPSSDYAGLSDADVAALYAHVASRPSVARKLPASRVGVLGSVLFLFGQLPLYSAEQIPHAQRAPAATPALEVSVEQGRYVAATCVGCHGAGLSGGHVPGTPPEFKDAANITPDATGIQGWTEADFLRAMREGKRPDGSAIDEFMPWKTFARMDEVELRALWAYLQTVPAKPRGNR